MIFDKSKVLFLLGGRDLEMATIKEILLTNGFKENEHFFDHDLVWGAKLSSYQDIINQHQDKLIYAIELIEDIPLPVNYKRIDHHSDYADKEASLFQIMKLLDITILREHELIAANDVNHIEGMRCICATQEEVDTIRKKDREIQGITSIEVETAKEEIQGIKEEGNIFVLKSSLDTFTPIVDYCTKRPLLVYSGSALMFYGNISQLKDVYSEQIENMEAFHGLSYFGFDKDYLSTKEMKNLIDEIVKILNEKEDTIYSYHTFMLPFVFTGKFEKAKNWKYEKFKITESRDYNEQVYFYKHVQEALFNFNGKADNDSEEFISTYYEYINQKGTYDISCKKGEYRLELDGISLRIFNTDVAILSFNLINTKHRHKNDILAINDFGRRVYPQFLGRDDFTKSTKNAILAKSITLNLEGEKFISEDFCYFNEIKNLQDNYNKLPNFIEHLLTDNFDNLTDIRPIIDDRMFVISQYNNDALVENYKVYCDDKYRYEEDDWWYKYIFVDGDDKTCQSKHMTKKFIQESTYDRWIEWGTLFGVSRYSFVAVTGSWYGKNILLPHIQTIYFQMFTLLLAYRASLIKFSDAIQDTTQQDTSDIAEETQKLYKRYLDFLNKLYFKEITAQDQGIELYQKAMEVMNIEKFISDLDNEINELHNYAQMIQEEKETKKLNTLNTMAGYLLPATVISGIAGMNIFPESFKALVEPDYTVLALVTAGTIGFTWFVLSKIKEKTK